jgi:hypothetical protein
VLAEGQKCTNVQIPTESARLRQKTCTVQVFLSSSLVLLRRQKKGGSVVGRLDMYRTYVLLYRTMVLMARPTKVRR